MVEIKEEMKSKFSEVLQKEPKRESGFLEFSFFPLAAFKHLSCFRNIQLMHECTDRSHGSTAD